MLRLAFLGFILDLASLHSMLSQSEVYVLSPTVLSLFKLWNGYGGTLEVGLSKSWRYRNVCSASPHTNVITYATGEFSVKILFWSTLSLKGIAKPQFMNSN
jgi:hypothetical protein